MYEIGHFKVQIQISPKSNGSTGNSEMHSNNVEYYPMGRQTDGHIYKQFHRPMACKLYAHGSMGHVG